MTKEELMEYIKTNLSIELKINKDAGSNFLSVIVYLDGEKVAGDSIIITNNLVD